MADDERGGFDDLFEDLDRFFAPGEGGEEARRRARERAQAGDEADLPGDGPPEEERPGPPQDPTDEAGEELLPPGWEPDIEGLAIPTDPPPPEDGTDDLPLVDEDEADEVEEEPIAIAIDDDDDEEEEEEIPQPGGERDGGDFSLDAGAPGEPAAGEEEAEDPDAAWRPEPTGEMTSEDWTRLRDVLGDDEGDDEEVDFLAGATRPEDESLFAYDDSDISGEVPPSEDRRDLTLEDLKKAPPEYAELPRAPDDDVPPAEEPLLTRDDVPLDQEPSWDEPEISEVEAAADRLAAEFRDAEPLGEVEQDLLSDLDEPRVPRTVKVGEVETLTGPAWEEPASRPLMSEPSAPVSPGGGRDLPAAVLTGVGLALAAIITLALGAPYFAVLAGVVVLIGQFELYATMRRKGYNPAIPLGLVLGALTMAGAYRKGEPAMAFFVVLALVLSFLWYMAAPLKAREGLIRNVGGTLLGVMYGPLLAGFALMLLTQRDRGRSLMLVVIGLTFAYDIVAFGLGSLWGRRPLAPTISPRKSWEGLLWASGFALLVGTVAVKGFLHYFSVAEALGLSLVIVAFAPLGDLVESSIKRDLGVKDMGSLLPGHGGVLDRIDSVLLVAPAAFYFLRLIA